MEALLRKLEESQQMLNEAATRLQPSEQPPKKYVSIFSVDGKPILPPLMTSERRKEMQKLKQEAIKVERKLKKQYSHCNTNEEDTQEDETTLALSSFCCDNVHQESNEADKLKCFKAEEVQKKGVDSTLCSKLYDTNSDSTSTAAYQQFSQVQKLKKSKTIICDINKEEVVQNKEQNLIIDCKKYTADRKCNVLKRPTHLCLVNNNNYHHNTDTSNCNKNVPSIYVNPPTPLKDYKDDYNDIQKSTKAYAKIADSTMSTMSSDDSCESQHFHYSTPISNCECNHNSAAEVKRTPLIYEQIKQSKVNYKNHYGSPQSSGYRTPNKTATTPNVNLMKNIKECVNQKTDSTNLEIPVPLNRSSTSPSLKRTCNDDNVVSSNSVYLKNTESLPENEIIRSNSFTLKAPSKALVDHMRQQHEQHQPMQQKQQQMANKNTRNDGMNSTLGISPARLTKLKNRFSQDTVESKAKKKIQKVECKTSRGVLESKCSPCRLTNSSYAMSSSSPSSMQYSYCGSKTKRSPYESTLSSYSNTKQQLRKVKIHSEPTIPKSPCKQIKMRQSASTLTSAQQTPLKSPLPVKYQQQKNPNTCQMSENCTTPIAVNFMDNKKKALFIKLLAQQEEERQKLQKTFELQQKMLLAELNGKPAIPESPKYYLNDGNDNTYQTQGTPRKTPSSLTFTSPGISITNVESSSFHNNSPHTTISSIDSFPSYDQTNSMYKSAGNDNTNSNNNSVRGSAKLTTATPRRRLFGQDTPTLHANNNSNGKLSISNPRLCHTDKDAAATTINAYVRGYLVRRLFQTEQLQRLIQTVRDTLIFLLNLYMESTQNSQEALEPANIKLKGRLLQQLFSANRSLHATLFETTVKERMDIIAQDRKRLKIKLLALHKKKA